jgi:hypothetical protein
MPDDTSEDVSPTAPAPRERKNIQAENEIVQNDKTETNSVIDISGACLHVTKESHESEMSLF